MRAFLTSPLRVLPSLALTALVAACALGLACGSRTEPGKLTADPVRSDPVAPPAAVLPAEAGEWGPARLVQSRGPAAQGAHLGDVESCAECHQAVAAMWRGSVHAYSSFSNPIYRVAIEGLREQVGQRESRFCAGCHDMALLIDGAIASDVAPDDARAHAGITCRTCHGVSSVTVDGNGSYTLRGDPIPLPVAGDLASLERHKRAVTRKHLGSDLCGSCHRSFLDDTTGNPAALGGQNEMESWRSSPYAGNGLARVDHGVDERDCISCHMPKESSDREDPAADARGRVSSHRFMGAHTWLAAMRKDDDQLGRLRQMLKDSVSIDIAAAEVAGQATVFGADGAPLPDGGDVIVSVAIRNLGVGHHFPAGVRDAQDVWIELEARDERGKLLATAGRGHRTREDDPTAHVLRAMVVDEAGQPQLDRMTHQFRALVVDHTIGPRDTAVVNYRLPIAKGLGRVRLRARLLHRSRNLVLQARACAAHRSARGAAMAKASARFRGASLDPCAPQPITELASDEALLGQGATPVPEPRPRWQRLYELGAGLAHSVQEDLERAKAPLEAALVELEAGEGGWQRAAVYAELAKISGRQGRTIDALALLERAERDARGHPALAAIRGRALMRVWRWDEAIGPLEYAASKAPGNTQAWVRLAMALGSAGRDLAALNAAHKGLALEPRQADLLRVQALSLKALSAPHAAALSAYDRYRSPDAGSRLRIACAQRSSDCARERSPVHVHPMITP